MLAPVPRTANKSDRRTERRLRRSYLHERKRKREEARTYVRTLVGCVYTSRKCISFSLGVYQTRILRLVRISPPIYIYIRAWVRKHRYRATEKFHLSRESILELRELPGENWTLSLRLFCRARSRSIKINKRLSASSASLRTDADRPGAA